jgi:pyoverdine/dityrosine biosynthesis protein Dit1
MSRLQQLEEAPWKISTDAIGADEEVPEFNTDQGNGTHRLCHALLQEHGDASVPDWEASARFIDASSLRALMFQRREYARAAAKSMADGALKDKLSPAEAVLGILDKRGLRRGSAKSDLGRTSCLAGIQQALAKEGPLTLAVLTFPFHDRHPFKTVGQLPDAGEIESLLRFWTIAKAINMCGIDCKFIALRDGNRYPCTWHISPNMKRAYGEAMRELVHGLEIDDVVEVRDVDDKGPLETQTAYEQRIDAHSLMYKDELARFMDELISHWACLKVASCEADFAFRLSQLPSGCILLPMFYPMLHWSPPCATPAFDSSYSHAERLAVIKRLVNVFKPCQVPLEEDTRQELLWQALCAAAQYISAYRSRSAANNVLGLDDVAAAAPNSLRCSIHNKSKDNGSQFPLQVSGNVHRTPWHGTAELRFSRQEKLAVIDVKLAAEMWHSHVAVLPMVSCVDLSASASPTSSWMAYCNRLAKARQPFFFADESSLPAGWADEKLETLMARTCRSVAQLRQEKKQRKLQQCAQKGGA